MPVIEKCDRCRKHLTTERRGCLLRTGRLHDGLIDVVLCKKCIHAVKEFIEEGTTSPYYFTAKSVKEIPEGMENRDLYEIVHQREEMIAKQQRDRIKDEKDTEIKELKRKLEVYAEYYETCGSCGEQGHASKGFEQGYCIFCGE